MVWQQLKDGSHCAARDLWCHDIAGTIFPEGKKYQRYYYLLILPSLGKYFLFSKVPLDKRFVRQTWQKYPPSTNINGTKNELQFVMRGRENTDCFLPHHIILLISIRMVDSETGLAPKPDGELSCCNNIGHSLFRDVKVYLNDQLMNSTTQNYHYK